jgi:hypothetical protein
MKYSADNADIITKTLNLSKEGRKDFIRLDYGTM